MELPAREGEGGRRRERAGEGGRGRTMGGCAAGGAPGSRACRRRSRRARCSRCRRGSPSCPPGTRATASFYPPPKKNAHTHYLSLYVSLSHTHTISLYLSYARTSRPTFGPPSSPSPTTISWMKMTSYRGHGRVRRSSALVSQPEHGVLHGALRHVCAEGGAAFSLSPNSSRFPRPLSASRCLGEKGVRLAQTMQVGPCIPVGQEL